MITTTSNFVIADSSKIEYAGAKIYSVPQFFDEDDNIKIDVRILGADNEYIGGTLLEATTSDLTAFTASGANEVEKFFNLVEQYVKDWLEDFTDNTGVTFTIA